MNRRIAQIAIVSSDQYRSTNFFSNAFGLDHIFGTTAFRDDVAEKIQGIKGVASATRWLIDDRAFFQLEVFEFENPQSKPLPAAHNISDIGYNRLIIAVKSLAESQRLVTAAGGTAIPQESGEATGRTLFKDPDNILLELVEAPERVPGSRPACIVGLGLTTRDLAASVEGMCDGFGFSPCDDLFQHDSLWQENGQLEKSQTLQLDDMFLVISQYCDSRPRAADYSLANIGVMNFAVGFPSQEDFGSCLTHIENMGMQPNSEPLVIGNNASVTYVQDRLGYSVEMIFVSRKLWRLFGFAPPKLFDRLLNAFLEWKAQRNFDKRRRKGLI